MKKKKRTGSFRSILLTRCLITAGRPVSNSFNASVKTRGYRKAYFYFRDEIENFSFSLLVSRDENENLSSLRNAGPNVPNILALPKLCWHQPPPPSPIGPAFPPLISGFETRSRNSVVQSQYSRKDREFIVPIFFAIYPIPLSLLSNIAMHCARMSTEDCLEVEWKWK